MSQHPQYKLPEDPHAAYRYKSAMKHVELAKQAGKSSEEIHEMFKKIMNFDINDENYVPSEGHENYFKAITAAKAAMAEGKSSEEVHKIFQEIAGTM